LIVGFLTPDEGQIDLLGCERHQLGYLPERPHFPARFKLDEYLHIVDKLSGNEKTGSNSRVQRVLEQTGLGQVSNWRISSCSKGMLQRLAVAQALLSEPPLLLLDEPLSGLDPAAQAAMRYLIRELCRSGKTVVLSTHRLSDVTQVCSHIAILSRGQLARSGPLEEVLVPRSQVVIVVDHLPETLAARIEQLHANVQVNGNEIILPGESMPMKPVVLRLLLDAQIEVQRLEQQRATLEEVYLQSVKGGPVPSEGVA
jgi:ABC-2 type transport system ATP-binding protein